MNKMTKKLYNKNVLIVFFMLFIVFGVVFVFDDVFFVFVLCVLVLV